MTLVLRYSTRSQSLQGLYDLVDQETDEIVTDQPLPRDTAILARALYSLSKAVEARSKAPDQA